MRPPQSTTWAFVCASEGCSEIQRRAILASSTSNAPSIMKSGKARRAFRNNSEFDMHEFQQIRGARANLIQSSVAEKGDMRIEIKTVAAFWMRGFAFQSGGNG